MFEPTEDNHRFLGHSRRVTPTIPKSQTPAGRPQIKAHNDNVGPARKFEEPATPQPREASTKPKSVVGAPGQVGLNS